ncbi:PilW family protein [Massilia phosphatilytica]
MIRAPELRRHGFSLVELMVSVVIGLLALLFALRMVGGAERTRNAALGGSDEMQNGMVALFAVSNDARSAGYGLNDPIIAGCNTQFSDTKGYQLAPATRGTTDVTPLAAVVIEAHGADPDRVTFYAGTSIGGTPTLRLTSDAAAGATQLDVDRIVYGFNQGDALVVAPEQPGGDCLLVQRSDSDPTATRVQVAADAGMRFNGGTPSATFKGYGARVFDLGPVDSLAFRSWSVADGYLQLQATGPDDAAAQPSTVAEDIVSIKAQYGFDTRTGGAFQPQAGLQVNRWSAAMIDADGSGTAGDAADWQHIAAVRLAIVARSKAVERPAAGAACTTTTAQPVVSADDAPAGVAAAPVTVNVAVTGDPLDWRCYRYRAFETVVTLRNAGWRPNP